MYLLNLPRMGLNSSRGHGIVEARARELTDLFQAIGSVEALASESFSSHESVLFQALAESEDFLKIYFEVPRVGLCILDADFRYRAINNALAEMNGIPTASHVGKTVREMLGDFAEMIEPHLKHVLAAGQAVVNIELSFVLHNRTEPGHWIEHYIPIKDAAGGVIQIGVVAVETTEERRLEQSLHSVSQKLKLEKRRVQVMSEVSRVLALKMNVQEAFAKISAQLRRVLRQEYAALALRDEGSGQLVRQALDFPLAKSSGGELSSPKGPAGRALKEGSTLMFTAEQVKALDPEVGAKLSDEGLKSMCCVPLIGHKGPFGVLLLGSTRADAFDSGEVALANQVAAQLAIALENTRIGREVKQLRSRLELEKGYLEGIAPTQAHFEEIIGHSAALKEMLDRVAVVADSDATVLLMGETGTGKGLIARAIHRTSKRKERGFITLNCAAIPTGLLESELFGHEKGAFTGAISQKIGRLELAGKGTLFLDEIGEIPLDLQPKLLRVLQDHEFERLGGTRTIKVDMRLIAATNRDLARSVAEKEFRSDLFYRLNVFPIRIPSLRERREDIPLLIRHFVRKFAAAMDRGIETVPSETMDALVNWHWPGNVRELENFMERSVILTNGTVLRAPLADFRSEILDSPELSLESKEREHIVRVLRETRGMISGPAGAAKRLGLKRTTLQSKIQRLRITRADYSDQE